MTGCGCISLVCMAKEVREVWGGGSQAAEEDCSAKQVLMACQSPRLEPLFGIGWPLGRWIHLLIILTWPELWYS